MKKVFLVLVLFAAYGVSMAMSGPSVITVDNMQTVLVADMNDNNVVASEAEKEKATKKEAKAVKSEGCAGEKSAAKSEGCAGEKTAAKSECCAAKSKTASAENK